MKLKRALVFAGVLIGSAWVSGSHALEAAPVSIFPVSGQFLESQKFDIAVNVSSSVPLPDTLVAPSYDPYSSNSPIRINAFVNGRDVTSWFSECMQEHRTAATASRVLLCKSLDSSPFTLGDNALRIEVFNGVQVFAAEAIYTFVASDRKARPLPYHFVVQGKSFNTATGIKVALNDRLNISASGFVNTWPANTSFPISTPKGTQVCALNSTCLLPGAPVGGLLVKIGNYGRWVYIGNGVPLMADRPGEVIFAVNDKTELAATSDNTGSYDVTVSKY